MAELGKIEKPSVESFTGKRKLYCVPSVYPVKDAPDDYAGLVGRYWEEVLQQRERLRKQHAEFLRSQEQTVLDQDCRLIKELSNNLPLVWNASTTSMQERKTLLRFLVNRVHLDGVSEKGKIRIEVEWHTGKRSSLKVDRPLMGVWAPKTPEKALRRIEGLLSEYTYAKVASKLNREGLKTAKGLRFGATTVGYIARSRGWRQRRGSEKGITAQK